jgi:hypothetical protein
MIKAMIHLTRLYLATALVVATSSALLAQEPAAETLQQHVAVPTSTTNATSIPQSTSNTDLGQLGVVQTYPKPETLTLSTSQQFFYTDNVFYTNANTIASLAYLGSYTASYVPYSLRDWTPRVSLQYNMVRYGNAAEGDFDNENLAFSSQYVFSNDRLWSWTTDVNLSRFTDPHVNDHQFYSEVVYDNQISHVQPLIKDVPLYFISAYEIAYHQANPAMFDRLDNTIALSLSYYPIPQLSLGPFVHPGARNYFTNSGSQQNDRIDFNLSEGFDVTWQPSKYVSLSADLSHTNDYSNNAGLSYAETTPGLSVTGTVKFW